MNVQLYQPVPSGMSFPLVTLLIMDQILFPYVCINYWYISINRQNYSPAAFTQLAQSKMMLAHSCMHDGRLHINLRCRSMMKTKR